MTKSPSACDAPHRALAPQAYHCIIEWIPVVQCQGCGYRWSIRHGTSLPHERPCPACKATPWWSEPDAEAWILRHYEDYKVRMEHFYRRVQGKLKMTKGHRRVMETRITKALRTEKNKKKYMREARRLLGAIYGIRKKERLKNVEKVRAEAFRRYVRNSPDPADGNSTGGGAEGV